MARIEADTRALRELASVLLRAVVDARDGVSLLAVRASLLADDGDRALLLVESEVHDLKTTVERHLDILDELHRRLQALADSVDNLGRPASMSTAVANSTSTSVPVSTRPAEASRTSTTAVVSAAPLASWGRTRDRTIDLTLVTSADLPGLVRWGAYENFGQLFESVPHNGSDARRYREFAALAKKLVPMSSNCVDSTQLSHEERLVAETLTSSVEVIRVDRLSDGSWSVEAGCHRLWACLEAGVPCPVHLVDSTSAPAPRDIPVGPDRPTRRDNA